MEALEHRRVAGVLLHPTALPGGFGIGDLGPELRRFLAWLEDAGQRLWQVLPLGPPGLDSPYACLSAFAGNPLLISPEALAEDGLLASGDLEGLPSFPPGRVDFPAAARLKERLLRRAWERFTGGGAPGEVRRAVEAFQEAPEQRSWLPDWRLFSALRRRHDGRPWQQWEPTLARREPEALAAARRELAGEIAYHGFVQALFFRQWRRAREEARRRGLRVMGDLPIYVTADSAEVWARPHLFDLDENGRPRNVAGVPPDYFSETGQLWGNPLYDWQAMAEDGFAWWVERLAATLRLFDLTRLDHFRGFEAYWQVPAGAETAAGGRWVPGPGRALFDAAARHLGPLPLLAEDLGYITPEVERLRDELGMPGTRVLQFAFGAPDSPHLPHRHPRACAVYTGTHDNDTLRGWFACAGDEERRRALDYLGGSEETIARDLVRAAYTSVAELAVVPLQDLLELGPEARFNVPGVAAGNWAWRLRGQGHGSEIPPDLAPRLRWLAELTGRWAEVVAPP